MPIDVGRAEKFIGMLGSEHDGEQVNAARFLNKMALSEKMSLVEFFRAAFGGGKERIVYRDKIVEKTVYRDRTPERTSYAKEPPGPHSASARAQARKAYGYGSMESKIATVRSYHWDKLSDFEKDFLTSISEKLKNALDLTPKQRKILAQIFEKVGM